MLQAATLRPATRTFTRTAPLQAITGEVPAGGTNVTAKTVRSEPERRRARVACVVVSVTLGRLVTAPVVPEPVPVPAPLPPDPVMPSAPERSVPAMWPSIQPANDETRV